MSYVHTHPFRIGGDVYGFMIFMLWTSILWIAIPWITYYQFPGDIPENVR